MCSRRTCCPAGHPPGISSSDSRSPPAPARHRAQHPRGRAVRVVVVLAPSDAAGHGEELAQAHPGVPAGAQLGNQVGHGGIEPGEPAVVHRLPDEQGQRGLGGGVAQQPVPGPGAVEVPLVDQDAVDHHHQRGGDGDGQELVQVHDPPRPGHRGPQRDRPGGPGPRNGGGHLGVRLVPLRLAQRVYVGHMACISAPSPSYNNTGSTRIGTVDRRSTPTLLTGQRCASCGFVPQAATPH